VTKQREIVHYTARGLRGLEMRIKVVDTPNELFEYKADTLPRKDEFIFYDDKGYKVSYVSHHIYDNPDTGKAGDVYAVVEVSISRSFLGHTLKSY